MKNIIKYQLTLQTSSPCPTSPSISPLQNFHQVPVAELLATLRPLLPKPQRNSLKKVRTNHPPSHRDPSCWIPWSSNAKVNIHITSQVIICEDIQTILLPVFHPCINYRKSPGYLAPPVVTVLLNEETQKLVKPLVTDESNK